MFDSVPDGRRSNSPDAILMKFTPIIFARIREIAASGLVDCLAHLDLVKIHGHRPNARQSQSWWTKHWI